VAAAKPNHRTSIRKKTRDLSMSSAPRLDRESRWARSSTSFLRQRVRSRSLAISGENEAAPQQPALQELGQPAGVGHVGLAAGQVLDVVGID
jgi:hypothetical protein